MKRLFPVLLMLLMILSACSSEGYVTEPDIPNETRFYNYQFDMPSQSTPIGPYAESFADGVSGRIYYGIDSNGNMFLIGTEPATEPDVPTTPAEQTPAAAETTTAEPETTSAAETLPIETTEESVPDTLPVETTEEPAETPEETTEETSSETLPEETTTEEETTEEETTPAPTPAPTSPPPTTPKATEPKETDPPNPVMSNGKTQIWIDVDLSKQRVTIYNGDKEMNSFPCVTGCVNDGFGTPTGTFSILSKSRNRMLGGSSFVKYWMPFYQDYGLHDAAWRKGNFRSDHAYYYGSHGCVNMPEEGAQYIWDNCPKGTTVIVHGTVKNPGKHTGHDLSGPWEVEVEATCTEPGRMVQYCPYCYAVASNPRVIPAKGHDWGNWQTVNGVRQRVCSRCGLTETEGQHSHVWSAWTSDNDKTHTRSCTACSDKQTENHKFESVITPATTDKQGYTTYTCTECGFSYTGDYTDVHVHSYGKWTYSENNTHSRICTACGEGRETEACTFKKGDTIPPTENEQGYTIYTCTVCGYSYHDDFTEPIHVHDYTIRSVVEENYRTSVEGNDTIYWDKVVYSCSCGDAQSPVDEENHRDHNHSYTIRTVVEKNYRTSVEGEYTIYWDKVVYSCSCGDTQNPVDEENHREKNHTHNYTIRTVVEENYRNSVEGEYTIYWDKVVYSCSCGDAQDPVDEENHRDHNHSYTIRTVVEENYRNSVEGEYTIYWDKVVYSCSCGTSQAPVDEENHRVHNHSYTIRTVVEENYRTSEDGDYTIFWDKVVYSCSCGVALDPVDEENHREAKSTEPSETSSESGGN